MRVVSTIMLCVLMAGCASARHAPPDYKGEYWPINQQQQQQQSQKAASEVSNG